MRRGNGEGGSDIFIMHRDSGGPIFDCSSCRDGVLLLFQLQQLMRINLEELHAVVGGVQG